MEAPKSIGRYRIQRWLTSGAMGEIYEAHDPVIDRRIAIKTVRRDLSERSDADVWLDRFRNEVRAAGRLLHPNIVTVLDYGEEDGVPFLAMEYIEGEGVDRMLKRSGRLECRDAVSIMTQTLGALDFAHANGVIHRDIKPSNILVTKTGVVKLADFGIAHLEASDLTGEGMVLGTPSYMAPEQLAGRPVDHRADLFSAGAVLFELLSGAKPFQGRSLGESMLNIEQRGPSDICQLNPAVSGELRAAIYTALAYAPERRYASAMEFSQALTTVTARPGATKPAGVADETRLVSAEPVATPPIAPTPADTSPLLGADLLAEIERDLATYIGPMARIAVRRSARTIPDIEALYDSLGAYIDNPEERASFVALGRRRAQRQGSRPATPTGGSGSWPRQTSGGPGSLPVNLAPEQLSRIETSLTQYIGPIARIVLRQQLSKSASLADFYRDLAAHIPNERDRADFLKFHAVA
jgi:serine/threonine-protein kinase